MHPTLAAVRPVNDAPQLVNAVFPNLAPYLPLPIFQFPPSLTPPTHVPAVASTFHTQASQAGLVIVDLCGGIATSLDCVLRLGYSVKGYAYSDVDADARWVAHNRIQQLRINYPGQVPLDLHMTFMSHLPQDVNDIRPAHLTALIAAFPATPLMFVCGWPCQDLSPAGPNTGLDGARSSLLHAVLPVLTYLVQHNPGPVGYILENGATQHNFHSEHIRTVVTAEITQLLGQAVTVDAVQCGSYAHRLRNFWTNLAAPNQLAFLMNAIRPPPRSVQSILDLSLIHISEPTRRS